MARTGAAKTSQRTGYWAGLVSHRDRDPAHHQPRPGTGRDSCRMATGIPPITSRALALGGMVSHRDRDPAHHQPHPGTTNPWNIGASQG